MSEPRLFPPQPKISIPCGIFRTTQSLDSRVEENRLVYFHNHGDPGPGIYPVTNWRGNKAIFSTQGYTIDAAYAGTLKPLPPEGFYRIRENFTCCEKNCRTLEAETLVQLGYDIQGRGIVFVPTWNENGLSFPERGTLVLDDRLKLLSPLRVIMPTTGHEAPGHGA